MTQFVSIWLICLYINWTGKKLQVFFLKQTFDVEKFRWRFLEKLQALKSKVLLKLFRNIAEFYSITVKDSMQNVLHNSLVISPQAKGGTDGPTYTVSISV